MAFQPDIDQERGVIYVYHTNDLDICAAPQLKSSYINPEVIYLCLSLICMIYISKKKCSSLPPPRSIFITLNELGQINPIDVNFHLQKKNW